MGGGIDERKAVFMSYAHADAFQFTPRLAFALSMYVDVFWDRHMETGSFPNQLFGEIKSRDCFVLVVSPFALRDGGWCRKELEHAQRHNGSGIVIAKFSTSVVQTELEKELTSTYNCADFTEDFEVGFRFLTQIITGNPYSSWEYLANVSDDNYVLQFLQTGLIPGLIAKALAEWVIAEYLWSHVEDFVRETERLTNSRILNGSPRTLTGVNRQCLSIIQQFANDGNFLGLRLVQELNEMVSEFASTLPQIKDNDHPQACEFASGVVSKAKPLLQNQYIMRRNFSTVYEQQTHFDFNVAEKLRDLITQYSRRSRYLY